jgi:hypothetical protein
VVLEIFPYSLILDETFDTDLRQDVRVSNTRELQDMRRFDRPGTENGFLLHVDLVSVPRMSKFPTVKEEF